MITQKDKKSILEAFKKVDVKKMEIDHTDPQIVKWFRFGSYNAMQVASEIVKQMPESKNEHKQSK